jgi:RNA polymerase sigma-70 factor (ECF subfamily)
MTGDLEAFSELAGLWIDRLYGLARLILRDCEAAEDATQEALICAWRDLAALRDPGSFDSWLRRLLVNACYREARKSGRRNRQELHVSIIGADVLVGSAAIPDPFASLADRDQLERGFRSLSPQERALIVLHFYLDLPLRDTADALGLPVGTVKSRLHRTTRLLRASLDADARDAYDQDGRDATH